MISEDGYIITNHHVAGKCRHLLCRMSDGSTARISEFRRIGHPGTVGMSLYGTEASYEEQVGRLLEGDSPRS